jgi:hypothetical protein
MLVLVLDKNAGLVDTLVAVIQTVAPLPSPVTTFAENVVVQLVTGDPATVVNADVV